MKSTLEELLSRKIDELKKRSVHGQKIVNLIKENPLHIMLLDFLYSHKVYKNCVMYGGSALRIIYDLPRMSVDLDFQINFPLNKEMFAKEVAHYFRERYGYKDLGVNASTNQDRDTHVFWITFSGLDRFKIPNIRFTKLKVRLDFNKFKTENFGHDLVSRRIDDLNFTIRTYSMSTLMASKIAALMSRVQYGVTDSDGKSLLADYKGRDIYDTIWYLQRGVAPNLRYLEHKGHAYSNYPSLFKGIRARMSNLGDGGAALRADLTHLYLDPDELDEWMNKWYEFFLEGLQNYSFTKIKRFEKVRIGQNFDSGQYTFKYYYETDDGRQATFSIPVAEEYIEDFPISGFKSADIKLQMASSIDSNAEHAATEYAGLFYKKINEFLERVNGISPQRKIQTRLIQYPYTGNDPESVANYTYKELERCQLEDLF